MSVTVAVSGPAPGKTSFVPGSGPAKAVEAMQAGEGETSDFAALMRKATSAPANDPEGLKPSKSAPPSEGKKAKKDKIKGEGDLPVEVHASPVAEAVMAPIGAPARASAAGQPADGNAAGVDSIASAVSPDRVSTSPRPAPGEAMEPAISVLEAVAVSVVESAQTLATYGKKSGDASPDSTPEAKTGHGKIGGAGVDPVPATKAASEVSEEIGRATAKEGALPPGEPTRTRAGRQRAEGNTTAAPDRSNSKTAPESIRPGEATKSTTVVPEDMEAVAVSAVETAQTLTAQAKKSGNALPDATPEAKTGPDKIGGAGVDLVPATKAASEVSEELSPAALKESTLLPGEPTRTRAGRQRMEEGADASASRGNGDITSQPVRAGEATALLAVARRTDKRAPILVDEGAVIPRALDEKSSFPAKGAGAMHASAVAIAAVQSGPASATRTPGSQPKVAGEQADGTPGAREATPANRSDTLAASTSPAAAASPLPLMTAPAGGARMGGVALSGELGQQVVDMGVSGQWIDDIARQIATVAANPGHGSFRIASEALGAVRVDLTPGNNGSDVLMTVDNDAARAALSTETDRLMQDAELASVRLGDVRIERAVTSADAPRSDTSQQQGSGQGASAHAQAAMGQGSGQSGQHSARPDAAALMNQQQGGNSPKAPFIKSVLQDSGTLEQSAPDRGRSSDHARYA